MGGNSDDISCDGVIWFRDDWIHFLSCHEGMEKYIPFLFLPFLWYFELMLPEYSPIGRCFREYSIFLVIPRHPIGSSLSSAEPLIYVRLVGTRYTASVLFFGSARAKDREGWEKQMLKAEAEMAEANDEESRKVTVIEYLSMMGSLSLDTRNITELCI